MSSLIDRLKKNSTIEETATINKSKVFNQEPIIRTKVPMLNVALSGNLDGGLTSGVTVIAGPSRHFKTNFALLLVSQFLEEYKDGVVLFYDSEFGSNEGYFDSFAIDKSRVIHSPITDIEIMKVDFFKQLNEIKKGDPVMVLIDSLGQLASRKEVEDALAEKTVADMTRAKAIKGFFRLITPHCKLKNIPVIVVNHTYKEIGMFPKDILGGGTGPMLAADTVWILGRKQDKDKKENELRGYTFVINVEKSRFVKERSKIEINVGFDEGIEKYSGLLEVALEAGYVIKPKDGWYSRQLVEGDKNYREDETYTAEFWAPILDSINFQEYVRNKYELGNRPIYNLPQAVEETDD